MNNSEICAAVREGKVDFETHGFTCPECGGHYFGSSFPEGFNGRQVLDCHDQHDTGCRYSGEDGLSDEFDIDDLKRLCHDFERLLVAAKGYLDTASCATECVTPELERLENGLRAAIEEAER